MEQKENNFGPKILSIQQMENLFKDTQNSEEFRTFVKEKDIVSFKSYEMDAYASFFLFILEDAFNQKNYQGKTVINRILYYLRETQRLKSCFQHAVLDDSAKYFINENQYRIQEEWNQRIFRIKNLPDDQENFSEKQMKEEVVQMFKDFSDSDHIKAAEFLIRGIIFRGKCSDDLNLIEVNMNQQQQNGMKFEHLVYLASQFFCKITVLNGSLDKPVYASQPREDQHIYVFQDDQKRLFYGVKREILDDSDKNQQKEKGREGLKIVKDLQEKYQKIIQALQVDKFQLQDIDLERLQEVIRHKPVPVQAFFTKNDYILLEFQKISEIKNYEIDIQKLIKQEERILKVEIEGNTPNTNPQSEETKRPREEKEKVKTTIQQQQYQQYEVEPYDDSFQPREINLNKEENEILYQLLVHFRECKSINIDNQEILEYKNYQLMRREGLFEFDVYWTDKRHWLTPKSEKIGKFEEIFCFSQGNVNTAAMNNTILEQIHQFYYRLLQKYFFCRAIEDSYDFEILKKLVKGYLYDSYAEGYKFYFTLDKPEYSADTSGQLKENFKFMTINGQFVNVSWDGIKRGNEYNLFEPRLTSMIKKMKISLKQNFPQLQYFIKDC